MGIFAKKKTEGSQDLEATKSEVKVEAKTSEVKEEKTVAKKTESKPAAKKVKSDSKDLKGKTDQAYKILVKPLITEKATELGLLNKYVFEIAPKMNKVEVKKAIRAIYNVEPTDVNILNFSGKRVRFGRVRGQRRGWKKAVVTLKKGDAIEIYEGV